MRLHFHQVIDADFDRETALYDELLPELEKQHPGEWALIHHDGLVGTYPTLESARAEGSRHFPEGDQYLIRQIGGPPYSAIAPAKWTFY